MGFLFPMGTTAANLPRGRDRTSTAQNGVDMLVAPELELTEYGRGDGLIYTRLEPKDYAQTRLKNPYLEDLLTKPSR
ncbi:hypothetical protein [Ruegeria halocynthiae]|uniref:hypothetical protein n=1 Tax=Ruegeria halocynthiae TaxID=985054 RepID=UPI000569B4AC|nr:hypothetical protein [Ruegeria halocynthiae]